MPRCQGIFPRRLVCTVAGPPALRIEPIVLVSALSSGGYPVAVYLCTINLHIIPCTASLPIHTFAPSRAVDSSGIASTSS
ncbi:hypothetical protein PAXRUDRAFT_321231 [Paxillus rubicundulus Ve08.2h10]|uniref:Uncharacterized protein n=1 Tax=Paxillus rubicundulus Ve08.2h10 TaxID=930991 RepID=A0A0D0C5W2_9AGAM|nr:hypothetical protein PAXRUDRAFT_321231 [Paxillus rubicundulus Ve08.2h10]